MITQIAWIILKYSVKLFMVTQKRGRHHSVMQIIKCSSNAELYILKSLWLSDYESAVICGLTLAY